MTTAAVLYRQQHGRRASVGLAAVLVLAAIAAGHVIAQAIRIGDAGPMSPVTLRAIHRSVQRVIDDQFSEARLKLLMGLTQAAPPPGSAQANLSQQLQASGLASPKDGAASYLAATVSARGRELTEALSPLVDVALLNSVRLQLRDSPVAPGERLVLVERAAVQAIPSAASEAVLKKWTGSVVSDEAAGQAWALARPATRTETLADFLGTALPVERVRPLVARQLAVELLVSWSGDGDEGLSARDLTARFAWGTTSVLFIGLWIAAVMISAWQIWTLLPDGRAGLVAGITLVLAGVVGICVFNWPAISPDRIEIFGPVLGGLEADLGTRVILMSRVLTAMAAAAIVFLFAGAWSAVWQDSPDLLQTQLDGLGLIFNAGAGALVAGTLQVAALYSWAVAVVQTPGSDDALARTALIAAGYAGAVFSVVLLAIYLPPASVLKLRAKTVDPTVRLQLSQQGLADSASQKLLVLLQALAPLLAAIPISGLLALLSQ